MAVETGKTSLFMLILSLLNCFAEPLLRYGGLSDESTSGTCVLHVGESFDLDA
jgi:hypothetical protein